MTSLRKIMNIDNYSEFLSICRTCLGKKAIHPIFSDDASFSESVQLTTGVKVQMDDGLPQSICQNCVNNINNCLDFRRRCKDAEIQLLLMTNKGEINENIVEVKSELIEENGSEVITSNESKFNLSFENIAIKYEGKNSVKTECVQFNNLENFSNIKNSHNKNLVQNNDCEQNNSLIKTITSNGSKFNLLLENTTIKYEGNNSEKTEFVQFNNLENFSNSKNSPNKDVLQNTDKEQNNHLLACESCKSIVMGKFEALSTKHSPSENSAFMCKKCKTNLNRRPIGKHRKNKPIEHAIVLNKYTNANDISHNSDVKNDRSGRNKRNEIKGNSKICEDLQNNTCSGFKSETVNYRNEILNGNTSLSKKTFSVTEEFCDDKIKPVPGDTECLDGIYYTVNTTDSQRVTCKLCQKDLSRRSIDLHLSRHHPGVDKRRVKCDLCSSYVLKTKLGKHVATMHGSGFVCRYCKSGFDGKEALVEHVNSCNFKRRRNQDSSRELAQCEVCHKSMQKGSLKLHHAMKHAGLRPVCEHCGRSFGNKRRLHEHYRAKHGYEKFKCKLCDFQSACAVSMTNHERRHRGEKPFVCEACGAKFHAAYLLTQHRQSHADHSAYKCDLCPASFKANNALHMHKRACHSTTRHACKLCARVFSSRVYLARHMRGVHAHAKSNVDPVLNIPHMQTVTNVSPVQAVVTNVSPVQAVVTNVSPVQAVVTNVSPVQAVVTNMSPVQAVVTNVSPVQTGVTNVSPVKNVPNMSAEVS